MRTLSKVLFIVLTGSLLMSSCVSSKKYNELMADKDAMKANYEQKIDDLKGKIVAAEDVQAKLEGSINDLQKDLKLSEKAKLDLQNLNEAKEQELQKIKKEIALAFESIHNSDLKVEQKFDRLYVSLPNRVLYKKGSADLNKSGKEVIMQFAEVFKNNPKMDITVEGHTDADPVRRTKYLYKDNWGLSSARAIKVVRELVKAGVPSNQLSSAGRADINPTGEVKEGKDPKAFDRRIEFIITPDVHKLFSISKNVK